MSFFRGVVVAIEPTGMRKKITGFVPYAGQQEFPARDGIMTTVAVSARRFVHDMHSG